MKEKLEAAAQLPPLQFEATSKLRALDNNRKLLEMFEDIGIGEPTFTKSGRTRTVSLELIEVDRPGSLAGSSDDSKCHLNEG